ncbi:STRA6 [Branchiostoma lanceolatum]|uniref:STRA6 protein n=1 Tax=Branchiostoma lanceolatum TaxID=7740 RepID=A0A8K0EVT8_BRALA|nr:STRA6 [Branchiostoma lanceolatum]
MAKMAANISNSTRYCLTVDTVSFSDYALFVAIPILLLLSFLESRGDRGRRCGSEGHRCRRPGLLVPVNFLDTGRNRWAYAITLGASTNMCVTLFNGSFGDHFNKWFTLPDNDSKPWLQQLIALVSAMEVGLVYFPFLVCLKTTYRMVGLPLGLFYSIMWFVVYVLEHMGCLNNPNFVSVDLETTLPGAICHLILVVKFAELCKKFWSKGCRGLVDDDLDKVAQEGDFRYIRRLLIKTKPKTESWYRWYFRKYTRADDGIRLSARMTTTMVVSFLCLYSLAVLEIENGALLIEYIRQKFKNIDGMLYAFKVSWIVSGVAALLIHIVYILVIMVNYRKHMRALYRGDVSWMPSNFQSSTANSIYSGMNYSGTQIAFILWGFVVQQATFLLICGALYGLVSYPKLIVWILQYSGPTIGVTTATLAVQMSLSAFVFSQRKINPTDKDRPLAIDNRKFYHVTSYFMFFFNVMKGLFTSLLRVLLGGFLGGMSQARIDRSVFMQGFENWDFGFKSYLGMLRIEVAHNHPVLLVFCQRMLNAAKRMREIKSWRDHNPELRPLLSDVEFNFNSKDARFKKRLKLKWLVLYTIVRNPKVVGTKKHVIRMEESERDHVYRFLAGRVFAAKTAGEPRMSDQGSGNLRVKSLDKSYGTMRETDRYKAHPGP